MSENWKIVFFYLFTLVLVIILCLLNMIKVFGFELGNILLMIIGAYRIEFKIRKIIWRMCR